MFTLEIGEKTIFMARVSISFAVEKSMRVPYARASRMDLEPTTMNLARLFTREDGETTRRTDLEST